MPKVSMSITSAQCSVFLVGMEMRCPLCKVLVRSGEHHECRIELRKPARKKKESRR